MLQTLPRGSHPKYLWTPERYTRKEHHSDPSAAASTQSSEEDKASVNGTPALPTELNGTQKNWVFLRGPRETSSCAKTWPNPNQVVLFPKPNRSTSIALSLDKIEKYFCVFVCFNINKFWHISNVQRCTWRLDSTKITIFLTLEYLNPPTVSATV